MKYTYSSLALALLLNMAFSLQSQAQVGFAIGPKMGANVSNLTDNNNGSFTARTSWAGGLFGSLILGEIFVIQPELLLRQGGATQNSNGNNSQVKLKSFQIPILFKLRLPIGKAVYPHVFAGPTIDYTTSSSYTKYDTQSGSNVNVNTTKFKKSNVGGVIGAGLDIEVRHLFLNFDVRYGLGLTKISDNDLAVRGKYYTIMAGFGYRFGSK